MPVSAVRAVVLLAGSSLFADTTLQGVPQLDSVGRLTLDGALVVAVTVLWRALAAKDKQVIDMTAKVTETMVAVLGAVRELRGAVNDLRRESGVTSHREVE